MTCTRIKWLSALGTALALILLAAPPVAHAAEAARVHIALRNHRFQPVDPHAPAGKPFIIVVKNYDTTPAEFESNTLRVEKIVVGGGTITLRMRPLTPGRYRFFDDFQDSVEGHLIVK